MAALERLYLLARERLRFSLPALQAYRVGTEWRALLGGAGGTNAGADPLDLQVEAARAGRGLRERFDACGAIARRAGGDGHKVHAKPPVCAVECNAPELASRCGQRSVRPWARTEGVTLE